VTSANNQPTMIALARLLEDIHEGIYVGVLAIDPHDRDATLIANTHLRRMLGYSANTPESEVLPLSAATFVDAADRGALIDRLRTAGRIDGYLVRLRRADRSEVPIEITARGKARDERFVAVDAVLRDANERATLAERERELQLQETVHAERMSALGYALSSVAHELNNPLATIIGWAERIAEEPFNESTRRGAPMMLREAQRAARIVRNLLTLSRKRPSTRTLADVNLIIRETLALRAHDQRALGIRVTATLRPALPSVFVDGQQIQQVLLNLVINAEQAMSAAHGRGSIEIRSSHDEQRRRVAIEVKDDGPGIPETVKDRIFDPFFTTKGAGQGTGLGLTVAHAIVREHGGEIAVTSRPNGTTFRVELPVADAAAFSQAGRAPGS
jgi:two-component system NtrC family sensor kinase